MHKVKNIKPSYNYSRIDSSISIDSYLDSSISYLSNWDHDKTLIRETNRLEHVEITKLVDYNQINYFIENQLEFDSISSLENNPVKDPLPIVTIILREWKNMADLELRSNMPVGQWIHWQHDKPQ